MLILTDKVIPHALALPLEAWNFPKIIILRPGSGHGRNAIDRLCSDFIVIEHLTMPPARTSWLLADALNLARYHLENDNQPFLFLDQPSLPANAPIFDPTAIQKRSCEARFGYGGQLVQLRFSLEVPCGEVLPSLFSLFEAQQPDDAKFVELLKSTYFDGEQ